MDPGGSGEQPEGKAEYESGNNLVPGFLSGCSQLFPVVIGKLFAWRRSFCMRGTSLDFVLAGGVIECGARGDSISDTHAAPAA